MLRARFGSAVVGLLRLLRAPAGRRGSPRARPPRASSALPLPRLALSAAIRSMMRAGSAAGLGGLGDVLALHLLLDVGLDPLPHLVVVLRRVERLGRDLVDQLLARASAPARAPRRRAAARRPASGPRRRTAAAAAPARARRWSGAASPGTACRAPRSAPAPPGPSPASPPPAAGRPCRRPSRGRGSRGGRSRPDRSPPAGRTPRCRCCWVAFSSSDFSSSGVNVTYWSFANS